MLFNRTLFNRTLFNRLVAILGEVEIVNLFGSVEKAFELLGSLDIVEELIGRINKIELLQARINKDSSLLGSITEMLLEGEIDLLKELLGKYTIE